MAKSDKQVTEATVRQAKIDFEQNVFMEVMRFNMQEDQVKIAAKADTIAQKGYDVTKQRFLIGKVDVIKLNSAETQLMLPRETTFKAFKIIGKVITI